MLTLGPTIFGTISDKDKPIFLQIDVSHLHGGQLWESSQPPSSMGVTPGM